MISCSEHWPTCCYTCFYPPTHYIHITDDYLSKIYPYNSAAILIMRYLVRNSVTLNFVFQSWHLRSIFEAISEHRDIYLYIKYHDKDKKYCKVLNFFLSFRGFYWTHGMFGQASGASCKCVFITQPEQKIVKNTQYSFLETKLTSSTCWNNQQNLQKVFH